MYEFTVIMALVDYIPVVCFAITAVILMRDFYYQMPKYGFAMLAAGTINVFCAGFLKATWKLLYAAGVCDFQALNAIFLPTQSLGFLMAGIAMVILVCNNRKKVAAAIAAPPVFSGTAIFLVMMVAGLGCICTCLSILAVRRKKAVAVALFVLAFVASMGMGYAGRLDSTASWVNWLEQSINIVSQASLLGGVWLLHRAQNGESAGSAD